MLFAPAAAQAIVLQPVHDGFEESPAAEWNDNSGVWQEDTTAADAHAGSHSETIPDNGSNSALETVSNIRVPATASSATFSFFQKYDTVSGDGGQLLISTDGGQHFQAPTSFITGGPSSGNVWSGTQPSYFETQVDLLPYAGEDIVLEFSFNSSHVKAGGGWWIDDTDATIVVPGASASLNHAFANANGVQSGTPATGITASDCGTTKTHGTPSGSLALYRTWGVVNEDAEATCFAAVVTAPATCTLYPAAYKDIFLPDSMTSNFLTDSTPSSGGSSTHIDFTLNGGQRGVVDLVQTGGSGCDSGDGTVLTMTDANPPDTSITGGPSGTTASNTPSFTFASTAANSTFQCSIDGGSFTPCSSGQSFGPLALGSHTLRVFATDPNVVPDLTPASQSFTVVSPPPTTGNSQQTGSAGQTGGTGGGAVTVSGFQLGTHTFRAFPSGGSVAAAKAPRGTKVSYTSSATGTATFTVTQTQPGKRVKSGSRTKCVKPTNKNRKAKSCKRTVTVGSFTRATTQGLNRFTFTGRLHNRALKPGKYKMTLVVTDSAGHRSSSPTVSFTIVE